LGGFANATKNQLNGIKNSEQFDFTY